VYVNNVEPREPRVKAIAADPLCVSLLELVLQFRRSELAVRAMVSKVSMLVTTFHFRGFEPALRVTCPSFGKTTV
jgi:hypothetical protein